MTKLSQLAELDLSRCNLDRLPEAVATLPALRRLALGNNYLSALPVGPYLACLERLDLRWNR